MLEELRTPLEKVWADEFARYVELFYKFFPKRPFHHRFRYGAGFLCAKGTYKGRDAKYDRTCCPALIGKHLDYWRWQNCRPEKACSPNYWIAMFPGKKSALKAIDFDNKQNLLGYYLDVAGKPRPLPTLPLEHLHAVKRLYDAFPGRIWCVSSATLGLHLWQRMPSPQSIEAIQAADRPRLREIGLGGTEIHPMHGRCFRRPFGQDYFTITDDGLLEHWVKQLDWFEKAAEPPSFRAVYQALRSLLVREWDGYGSTGKMEKVGLLEGKPHLLKYYRGKDVFNAEQLDDDLETLDAWADQGFPQVLAVSVAVLTDLYPVNLPGIRHAAPDRPRQDTFRGKKPASGCEIDLSEVCEGQWVQNCEKWARDGLPCHDSVFQVVSQLARWFCFIEWWDVPEDVRLEKIVDLLTDFVLAKHNGFVSRLDAGQERDVVKQVSRIVECAVTKVDESGKWDFMRVRYKRQSGQYQRIIFLEPIIRMSQGGKAAEDQDSQGQEERLIGMEDSNVFSPPVGFNICCSDLREENPQNQTRIESQPHDKTHSLPLEVNNGLTDSGDIDKASSRRMEAEQWKFQPDDTPLPDELKATIEDAYREGSKRLYRPTMRKITWFINFLNKKGGEARLGVKALAKMGFPDYDARKHLEMLAAAEIVRKVKGYSPTLAQGLRFRLTKRTMTMFGSSEIQARSA